MPEHFYALIMAGGGGTRLWPMSRSATPKQLLPLVENQSMFRVSIERLAPLFTPAQIFVVAGRGLTSALMADAPEIPPENFIQEPYGRDNGPAALLGMTVIAARDPQATVAILTADHHIADKAGLRAALQSAYEAAQRDYIVTLGIMPSFPATGFGYIHRAEEIGQFNGLTVYHSLGFTEKPPLEKAVEFLASGDYSWNSGMFIWKAGQAFAEYERQQPAMYEAFAPLAAAVDTPQFEDALDTTWEQIGKISIDYAVMEDAQRMAVIPVSIGWSDVGSWASLFEVVERDEAGNCFKGKPHPHIAIDTQDALVFADKLTVLVGMKDVVVVDTPDALLICQRDQAQTVKDVVNRLKAENLDQLL
jgi:mannose-1-phosphate guanylyltransferase